MKNNNRVYTTDINRADFENTKVTVEDVVAFINEKTVFHANILKNKDRVAIKDRANKKCAEFAFRNKSNTFSCALQCNRFDYASMYDTARALNVEYKYHECKNKRNYITVNKVDIDDAMNFVFEMFDSVIDN